LRPIPAGHYPFHGSEARRLRKLRFGHPRPRLKVPHRRGICGGEGARRRPVLP
jgi:hypothetical protein